MARKLIDQEEAARILGVSPEEVGSLRDRKKLFPYRDGDQWKFKQEDLERLKAEMDEDRAEKSSGGGGEEWTGDSHMSDVELELADGTDSILLSEVEMGNSAKEGMSTIIGKMTEDVALDADLPPATGTRAIVSESTGDSGITLANDSGITLSTDSEIKLGEGGSAIPLGMESDVKLVASDSDIGLKSPGGSSDKLFGSDALRLSDDELSLVDSVKQSKPKGGDSGKKAAGSSIKLGDEEIEVMLGGGSDVTQSPTDSGIQLISASDSGLSLDQPLALGSSARKLLESSDAADLSELGGEAKPDDDFLLTALDDTGAEESSDSGSQVIALDSDDEISSGMFAPLAGGAGLLEEEPMGAPGAAVVTAASPTMMAAPAMVTTTGPAETPFSGWNVAVLSICAVFLMLCGMLTFDLIRNMWSWDGPYQLNSSIMDSVVGLFGK